MPIWQNEPPEPSDFAGIRIFRVAASATTTGFCTSSRITGCATHYAHRRTQPCEGAGCKICETHGPARWHGWIGLATIKSRYVAVLELTALAAQPLADYLLRHGSLRGALISASRIGNRSNSPVQCRIEPSDTDLRTLPPEIDMQRFLTTLWNPDSRRHTQPDLNPEPTADPKPSDSLIPPPANGEAARPTVAARGRRPGR
jgi:hypothetical protein